MPIYYNYYQAIKGSQTLVDGALHDYDWPPSTAWSTWSYSGNVSEFSVIENANGAVNFNADTLNIINGDEEVGIGTDPANPNGQGVLAGGQIVGVSFSYVLVVTDGTTRYPIGVIDADLNGDGIFEGPGEDGWRLIFIGAVPPPNVPLTRYSLTDAPSGLPHASAGGVLGPPITCFASGTLIDTEAGPIAVEAIEIGTLVKTADSGFQPVRWIGKRRIFETELRTNSNLCPVRIRAYALGDGPYQDLLVSPQHRVLIDSPAATQMFGSSEVFVAAKHLLSLTGIDACDAAGGCEYFHILLDEHQVIFANGLPTESLFLGPMARNSLGPQAMAEIFSIFPNLWPMTSHGSPKGARPFINGRECRMLLSAMKTTWCSQACQDLSA